MIVPYLSTTSSAMEPHRGSGLVLHARLLLPPKARLLRDDAAEGVRAVPVCVRGGADHVHVQLRQLQRPVQVREESGFRFQDVA